MKKSTQKHYWVNYHFFHLRNEFQSYSCYMSVTFIAIELVPNKLIFCHYV